MTKPLVDGSTYPGTIYVPVGGDARTAASVESPFQQLTDRTAVLKTTTDARAANDRIWMRIQVSDAIAGNSYLYELVETYSPSSQFYDFVNNGGFTIVSNAIEVPSAGLYEVSAHIPITTDAAEGQNAKDILRVGGSDEYSFICMSRDPTNDQRKLTAFSCIVDITTPASERISLYTAGYTHSVPTLPAKEEAYIAVRKIGPTP
jgi:hypothetical protein